MKKEVRLEDKLYTRHGKKYPQGVPAIVNGQKVLASYEGEEIIGYTTLEELLQVFYSKPLPVCTLEI